MSASEPKPDPAAAQTGKTPEAGAPEGGCLGAMLLLGFWSTIWLGLCFLVYWKVSTVAAAVVFFGPPMAFILWAMYTKPAGSGGLDRKQ